ncbi:MAG: hypothetical protein Q9186_006150 [Xanthomendoza sp. 1 TL-2023]
MDTGMFSDESISELGLDILKTPRRAHFHFNPVTAKLGPGSPRPRDKFESIWGRFLDKETEFFFDEMVRRAKAEYGPNEEWPGDHAFAIVDFGAKNVADAKKTIRANYKMFLELILMDWKSHELKESLARMKLRSGRLVGPYKVWDGKEAMAEYITMF